LGSFNTWDFCLATFPHHSTDRERGSQNVKNTVLKERIVLGRLVNRDSFSERAMALSQRGKFRYLDRMATSSRTMVQNSAKSNYHQLRHQLFTHSPQTRVQSDLRHMLVGSRTGRAKRAQ